jgi:murein L,D-transpeptidase YcbB/YkuD
MSLYQPAVQGTGNRAFDPRARCFQLRCACAIAMASCIGAAAALSQLPRAVVQSLRADIANGAIEGVQHGDLPRYRDALLQSYPETEASLRWIDNGALTPQGAGLVAELRRAEMRGLDPSDYDGRALALAFRILESGARGTTDDAVLRADAWLTLTAMRFMDHARRGRADPRALGFAIPREKEEPDFVSRVEKLSRCDDVHAMIDSLEPPYSRFRVLETLLGDYRTLAANDDLTRLPDIATALRPGGRWVGASKLRRLLSPLGDLPQLTPAIAAADTDSYDANLADGVKHFQQRHALDADGVIGRRTLAQLRTPIASRVTQIELTMERWRWLPDPVDPRLLVINIPEFHLYALERDSGAVEAEERMDVVVGSAYGGRRTPMFESTLRYVVFHPFWDVPGSIARREEIPKIRKNPAYASRMGMEIVRGGDLDAVRYPITESNLQRVISGTLRLRQRPGPLNALGEIKFVFPNRYNVYLHGTPEQSLFEQPRRDFSHGCIRASDPARLAEFVLREQDGWNRGRIQASIADAKTQTVMLDRPLRVFVVYATVVIDANGMPSFLPDVYGHDATLARALRLRSIAATTDLRVSADGRGEVRVDSSCLTDCSLSSSNPPARRCGS